MGGKATDVSWILGRLGVPSRALGFAAGPNGRRMESMLRERGVETDFTWVEGESRLNTILIVPGEGQSTITTSSLIVSGEHLSHFKGKYQEALEEATCVVMGGSLPPGVPPEIYPEAIAQARARGVPVIFDSSGESLIAGVRARPDLIKPNLAELHDLLGVIAETRQEALQAASRLHEEYGSNVILTLGPEGAVAVFQEGSYFVHPLSVPVVSVAGAGDGVLAGMTLAYSRREPLENGLRYGFALATAVLRTLPTADFQVDDYRQLLPQIKIDRL
jgi:1-phosphofructokinase family hexose kinase